MPEVLSEVDSVGLVENDPFGFQKPFLVLVTLHVAQGYLSFTVDHPMPGKSFCPGKRMQHSNHLAGGSSVARHGCYSPICGNLAFGNFPDGVNDFLCERGNAHGERIGDFRSPCKECMFILLICKRSLPVAPSLFIYPFHIGVSRKER